MVDADDSRTVVVREEVTWLLVKLPVVAFTDGVVVANTKAFVFVLVAVVLLCAANTDDTLLLNALF